MGKTKIEWADNSWGPLRAIVKADAAAIAAAKGYTSLVQIAAKMAGHVGPHCERVSDGCGKGDEGGCYSEANNSRCLPSNGTGLPFDRRARDLVDPFVDGKILAQPLGWRTAKRVFVCSQTDLFGEWVTDEMIDHVFAVMALCERHQFQCLTKRPERAVKYFRNPADLRDRLASLLVDPRFLDNWGTRKAWLGNPSRAGVAEGISKGWRSPLGAHIWIGVSAENQKTWDERTRQLEQIPAAIRFVSLEPQLAYVDVGPVLNQGNIRWVVQGGESGPSARPFDIAWARNTIAQCKAAGVACFVKQLGAKAFDASEGMLGYSGKGGDWECWPADLKVREFPDA